MAGVAAQVYIISIHTPAKGVTDYMPLTLQQRLISIHTPAKGVTD